MRQLGAVQGGGGGPAVAQAGAGRVSLVFLGWLSGWQMEGCGGDWGLCMWGGRAPEATQARAVTTALQWTWDALLYLLTPDLCCVVRRRRQAAASGTQEQQSKGFGSADAKKPPPPPQQTELKKTVRCACCWCAAAEVLLPHNRVPLGGKGLGMSPCSRAGSRYSLSGMAPIYINAGIPGSFLWTSSPSHYECCKRSAAFVLGAMQLPCSGAQEPVASCTVPFPPPSLPLLLLPSAGQKVAAGGGEPGRVDGVGGGAEAVCADRGQQQRLHSGAAAPLP